MADNVYATAIGFVQFDVQERDAAGQVLRDITVKTPGTDGQLVRITLWPDFADAEVERGDFVAADGKLEVREVEGNVYININANKLVVNGKNYKLAPTGEREVVGAKPKTKAF